MMNRWLCGVLGIALLATAGCAVTFAKRSPWDIQQLAQLSDELEKFKTLAQLKAEEADELRRAKALLEQRLSGAEATIGYDARGVVTRLLDQVLFDSGKAKLRRGALPVLNRVAQVLKEVPDQPVVVEGHTDNQPIKVSGWASNEALSLARAQAVVDYLIKQEIDAGRLSALGSGESKPIASNDTAEGRQQNRRVEIVITPQGDQAQRRGRKSWFGGYSK
ncbi:MAG: OmpA family protein [Candidatus Omnitrophica bacterium]|nr:OmpA family protein [Candidatus Omnitrophota bacterium]